MSDRDSAFRGPVSRRATGRDRASRTRSIAALALAATFLVGLSGMDPASAAPPAGVAPHLGLAVWTHLSPSSSPKPSDWGSMTYDGADRYVLLFGGNNATTQTNQTWRFAHGNWHRLAASHAPSPRRGAAMAFDPALQEVVLFGGADPNTGMNDTWTFHAGVWTKLALATSPPARASAMMVYDGGSKSLLMFGGTKDHCCSNAGLGDFWAFTRASTWVQLTPSTLPAQRNEYGFAFDRTLNEAVLFGGWQPSGGCGSVLNDSWTYAKRSWSPVPTPANLTPRQGAPMAWSPDTGAVLFGGVAGTCGTAATHLNQTWVYSSSGWTQVHPSRAPTPRAFSYFCYDELDQYLLLFGGENGRGVVGDTWAYT